MKKNKLVVLAVAFVLVVGLKSVNVNAATTYAETLPETVTRNAMSSNYRIMQPGFNITDGKTNAIIEFLSNDSNYLLYCSDRNNPNIDNAVTLTKGNQMDYKIAYVLTHGYNKQYLMEDGFSEVLEQGSSSGTETAQARGKDMVNLWITQAAIWNLQNSFTSTELNNEPIRYTLSDIGYYRLTSGSGNLSSAKLWQYVEALVDGANNSKDPSTATLSVTGDTKWTKSDNISKSGLITVASSNGAGTISNYSLILQLPEELADAVKLYTEDGKEVQEDSTAELGGTCSEEPCPKQKPYKVDGQKKMYLTLDNNKLDKSKEYNIKMNVYANLTYDAAFQYIDNSNQCNGVACQPSVLVGPTTKNIAGALDFKIVPDTASSLSKTIYYIGFIILLSGVGIIYANIRPKKQESE